MAKFLLTFLALLTGLALPQAAAAAPRAERVAGAAVLAEAAVAAAREQRCTKGPVVEPRRLARTARRVLVIPVLALGPCSTEISDRPLE